uniref:PH domain-containing protein n=1 Tax=Strongyloides papillosus TaxID=174720 RepID=A0A0N5BEL8_STREA
MSSICSGFSFSGGDSDDSLSSDNFEGYLDVLTNYEICDGKKGNLSDLENTIFSIVGDVDRRLYNIEHNVPKFDEMKANSNICEEKVSMMKIELDEISQRVSDVEKQLKRLLNFSNVDNTTNGSTISSFDDFDKFDKSTEISFRKQSDCIAKSKYFPAKIYNQNDETSKFSRNNLFNRVVFSFKSDCNWYLILTDEDDLNKEIFPLNDSKITIKRVKVQNRNMVSVRNSSKRYYMSFQQDDMDDFFEKLNSVK